MDSIAYRALFERHYLRVCNYVDVRTSGDWEASQEIARKAFASLWNDRDSIPFDRAPLSYLLHLVRQMLSCEMCTEGVGVEQESDDKVDMEENVSSEHANMQRLIWAVNQLEPQVREIFLLRKQKGFSNQEIAEFVDISIQVVEDLLGEALIQLRSILNDVISNKNMPVISPN
ncbi:MAG: sigma-70 family RNA polymerase sigma factor [Saprospiraceae bacterium]|nr:sigma-70 family RNA polymerase sigma factor [Saprospiraceae bacterium]